jgi:5-formyltetrahydrofolate cyclo-ligase
MTETIAEQKNRIRKDCRQIRKALGEALRAQASQEICSQIEGWPIFQRAQVILSYMPIKFEVDLRSLLAGHPGKTWVLPRILPEENHSMRFHPYDPQHLNLHAFGMAEPDADLPVVAPEQIELALVPGLAFDRNGWRLGYGGGYFDRFLREFGGVSLGVTFQALALDALPHDEYDMRMDWVVSEKMIWQTLK